SPATQSRQGANSAPEPAEQRYPGVAAHLHACGPCGEDFDELLAAVCGEAGLTGARDSLSALMIRAISS
ncbi:MAG TPA: hypothetical protein VJ347_09595, partial [Streptosporangiaceae bacterium]|nr:hypothetical protein [Streptosporangiaceae bacterium]